MTNSTTTPTISLGPVLITAVSTIATLVVLFFTASYFATRRKPGTTTDDADSVLLNPKTLKKLATVSTRCFLPALVFVNLSKSLDMDALAELWILPVLAIVQILIGLTVGKIVLGLLTYFLPRSWHVPPFFRGPFIAGCMFGNSSQLPLVVGYALCLQGPISKVPNAYARYSAANFLYLIGWSACFWSAGYVLLKEKTVDNDNPSIMNTNPSLSMSSTTPKKNTTSASSTEDKDKDAEHGTTSHIIQLPEKEQTCCGSIALWRTLNVPNFATVCGIIVGLIPGGKEVIFADSGQLRFLGSAFEILAQPAVCLMTLIVFSNLARQLYQMRYQKKEQDLVATELLTGEEDEGTNTLSMRMAIVFALTRIVLIGSIQVVLTSVILYQYKSSALGMPERLLLLVECFAPSANLVVVVSQQTGNDRGAAALASGYMIQYLLFVPALLAGASVSIYVAYTSSVVPA